MQKAAIYGIYVSGRIVYVGCTSNPKIRLRCHLNAAKNQNTKQSPVLYNCLSRCMASGVPIRFKLLEVCAKEDMYIREVFYIKSNSGKLLNQTCGSARREYEPQSVRFGKVEYKVWRRGWNSIETIYKQMTNKQVA